MNSSGMVGIMFFFWCPMNGPDGGACVLPQGRFGRGYKSVAFPFPFIGALPFPAPATPFLLTDSVFRSM